MKHSIKLHVKQVPLCAGSDVTWTQPAAARSVHPAAPRIRCAPVWPLANRPDAHRGTEREPCTAVSSRASPAPAQRAFAPAAGDTRGPAFPSAGSRGISRPLYAGARARARGRLAVPPAAGVGSGLVSVHGARWGCCRLPPPPTPCLALQRCGDPLRRPGAGSRVRHLQTAQRLCARQGKAVLQTAAWGGGPQPLWHRHQGPGPL